MNSMITITTTLITWSSTLWISSITPHILMVVTPTSTATRNNQSSNSTEEGCSTRCCLKCRYRDRTVGTLLYHSIMWDNINKCIIIIINPTTANFLRSIHNLNQCITSSNNNNTMICNSSNKLINYNHHNNSTDNTSEYWNLGFCSNWYILISFYFIDKFYL